jgi:hypothetical protein
VSETIDRPTVLEAHQIPNNEPNLITNGFIWGDRMILENVSSLRIGVANVGGLPVNHNDGKMNNVLAFVEDHNFNVIGIPEVNVNWQIQPTEGKLTERIKRRVGKRNPIQESKTTTAYYRDFNSIKRLQPGGTTQWAFDSAVHRITATGQDTTGLGRWVWQKYRGKAGRALRIVTAYRPCKSFGEATVWTQQKSHFLIKNITLCPRDLFTTHLIENIKLWLEEGDHLVIMLDLHENIHKSEWTTKLKELGLTEAIIARHGKHGPPTFTGGTKPIDGICMTSGITNSLCGYIRSPGDHHCLWLDIDFTAIMGHEKERPTPFNARRLKLQDPRVVTTNESCNCDVTGLADNRLRTL